MSRRASSLRQLWGHAALCGSAVLFTLIWPGATLGAGGAPLPAPDDPPAGHWVTTGGATTTARTAPSTSTIMPTPDPPTTPQPSRTTPSSAPAPTSTRTAAPVVPRQQAVTPVSSAAARATRAARPEAAPKPKPKPKATTTPRRTQPAIARAPHDAYRLGLPLGALAPAGDAASNTALLIAAGILLAASGAGSLAVGITVHRVARDA